MSVPPCSLILHQSLTCLTVNERNVAYVARAFDTVIREVGRLEDGSLKERQFTKGELLTPPKTPTEEDLAHDNLVMAESVEYVAT